MHPSTALLLALTATSPLTTTASILWDGRLNNHKTAAFLNSWSWSNPIGPYQYYIHGPKPVSHYIALSPHYANPADHGSKRGIRITVDKSSVWNDDGMFRTELIPQTSAKINEGMRWYHFSLQHTGTLEEGQEHQVCFFESAFTEMKYGLLSGEEAGSGDRDTLKWMVNSVEYWNVTFEPGVWHNVAYGIDFDGGSVTFYHSTGGADLVKTAGPVSVDASSNGEDWHLGVLRLPTENSEAVVSEEWHFSGVYIEEGSLTRSVSGPGGGSRKKAKAKSKERTKGSAKSASGSVGSDDGL